MGLEYLQEKGHHNISGQPDPVLRHSDSKDLPHVNMDPPVFHFLPVALCSIAARHGKESAPINLTLVLQVFIDSYEIPSQPSLLQTEESQLSQIFFVREMLRALLSSLSLSAVLFLGYNCLL